MTPCKLCGEPTRWTDALCTKCGIAQDRMLAKRYASLTGVAPSGGLSRERVSFLLGMLAGFSMALGGALALVLGKV